MELGYDDLKKLLDMLPEEIIEVLKEGALYDKSGHRKRFVSQYDSICNRNVEFEDQTRSTRMKTRQATVLHQCRVLPTMLQLVSTYILTCFAWRILKTKIILENRRASTSQRFVDSKSWKAN
jgi:hypothetical protein